MRRAAGGVQARRFARACVLVVALVCFPLVVEAFLTSASATEGAPTAESVLDIAMGVVQDGGDPARALDRIESSLERESQLPQRFVEEAGLVEGAYDVKATEAGDVVGYAVEGDPASVLERIDAHLAERGWKSVPLGGVDGATYLKDGGSLRWMMVTATQVGGATCIVHRLDRE